VGPSWILLLTVASLLALTTRTRQRELHTLDTV
jgi:hypothetical protein